MDRRHFLKLTAGVGVATTLGSGTACQSGSAPHTDTDAGTVTPETPASTRKNILFILCDDLNDHVNGFAGHPQAYTPNIDRLRALGTTFTNAHANAPLCAPSRPSLLSGLLPSSTGHYHGVPRYFRERSRLKDARLLPQHLRENGYAVYLTGKIPHEDGEIPSLFGAGNEWDPATHLGYLTNYGPYIWNGQRVIPESILNPAFPPAIQEMGFGFGRLSQPPQHSNGVAKFFYGNPSYVGVDGVNGGEFRYVSETDRSPTPDEMNVDWVIALLTGQPARSHSGKAVAKIATPIDAQHPFAIFCGLTSTHLPLYLPDALFDEVLSANGLASVDEITLPALLPGDLALLQGDAAASAAGAHDLDDIPYRLKAITSTGPTLFRKMLEAGATWPGGSVRLFKETIHAYLAAVLMLDKQVGKILDALQGSGLLESTVVVLTSDNGYARAEKNWAFKYNLWGESTRVPLVIHDPTIAGSANRTVDAPVSLVDLYPTLIDACVLPPVTASATQLPLDGNSLLALMRGETGAHPPAAICMVKTWMTPAADDVIHPDTVAVSAVSRHWRYTQSMVKDGVQEELYNLRSDPDEWHNLARDPALLDVKKFFDREFAARLLCGDMRRSRQYSSDCPSGFDPDALA